MTDEGRRHDVISMIPKICHDKVKLFFVFDKKMGPMLDYNVKEVTPPPPPHPPQNITTFADNRNKKSKQH